MLKTAPSRDIGGVGSREKSHGLIITQDHSDSSLAMIDTSPFNYDATKSLIVLMRELFTESPHRYVRVSVPPASSSSRSSRFITNNDHHRRLPTSFLH